MWSSLSDSEATATRIELDELGPFFADRSGVHAVLFHGADGAPLRDRANRIAKFWICVAPSASGPCGACKPCGAFDRGQSPDVLVIEPRGKSAWIRKSRIALGGSDEPDDDPSIPAQEFVRTLPLAARNKVVLLHSADRIYPAAASSLLKMLEEPEPHAKFVLTSNSLRSVMPTIVSRCLLRACALPSAEDLARAEAALEPWEAAMPDGSAARVAQVRAAGEAYRRIAEVARELGSARPAAALRLGDTVRDSGESLGESTGGARTGHAESWRALSLALRHFGARPEVILDATRTHRAIVANASAALATDAFFTRWTCEIDVK